MPEDWIRAMDGADPPGPPAGRVLELREAATNAEVLVADMLSTRRQAILDQAFGGVEKGELTPHAALSLWAQLCEIEHLRRKVAKAKIR